MAYTKYTGVKRKPKYARNEYTKSNKKAKFTMAKPISGKAMQQRGLGNATSCVFHYCDTKGFNPGALGITATQIWNLSSLYDPDQSGTGHQPTMHDQVAALYERYQVYRVDFHIEFINSDTSNPNRVGYRISDSATTPTDPSESIENGNGEWALLTKSGSDYSRCVFTGSVNLHDVHGITYQQYMSNDDYGSAFGGSPNELAWLHIWADGFGTDTGLVATCTHLVYYAKVMGSVLTNLS